MKAKENLHYNLIFKQIQSSLFLLLSNYFEIKENNFFIKNELSEEFYLFLKNTLENLDQIIKLNDKNDFVAKILEQKNKILIDYINVSLLMYDLSKLNNLIPSDEYYKNNVLIDSEEKYTLLLNEYRNNLFNDFNEKINSINKDNLNIGTLNIESDLLTLEENLNIYFECINNIYIIVNFANELDYLFEENLIYKDIFYTLMETNNYFEYIKEDALENLLEISENILDEMKSLEKSVKKLDLKPTEENSELIATLNIIDFLFYENIFDHLIH